jgi:hypothetical protein
LNLREKSVLASKLLLGDTLLNSVVSSFYYFTVFNLFHSKKLLISVYMIVFNCHLCQFNEFIQKRI